MKNIEFSLHSIQKIALLKKHSFEINIDDVIQTINNPEETHLGKWGRTIVQKNLDENHILRVIYDELNDKILVITCYPGRRKRYEKN